MKEIVGNYFTEAKNGYNVLVCTTNKMLTRDNRLVMGAGIAKEFRDRFCGLDVAFGNGIKANPQINLQFVDAYGKFDAKFFVAFPTKNDWRQPSDFDLIVRSTKQLVALADMLPFVPKVLMTRPGCGLGGMKWEGDIQATMWKYLDDRFTVINPS